MGEEGADAERCQQRKNLLRWNGDHLAVRNLGIYMREGMEMAISNSDTTSAKPYNSVPAINFFLYPPIAPVADGRTRSLDQDLGLDQTSSSDAVFVVYVSVPYCRNRCHSCCCFRGLLPGPGDGEQVVRDYVESLVRQIRACGATPRFSSRKCGAVYIGGGTASVLSAAQVDRLISALTSSFSLTDGFEMNLEINPVDGAPEYLSSVRKSGVTRLSIGYQSSQQAVLKALNTAHRSADSLAAARNALSAGFECLNLDLLYNVPGQTCAKWQEDLRIVLEMRPENISVGDYVVFPGSRAEQLIRAGCLPKQLPIDEAYEWYLWSCQELEHEGYREQVRGIHCIEGKQQKYVHLSCNESSEIIGVGAGAFGFINRYQFRVTSDSETYRSQIREGRFFEADGASPQASQRNLMERYIIHNLYSAEIDRPKFRLRFGEDPWMAFPEVFDSLRTHSLVQCDDRRIWLTATGKKWRKNVYHEFYSCKTEAT